MRNEEMEFYKEIGQRIRQSRGERGFTLSWVSGQLGKSYQQIQKFEKGKNRISVYDLVSLAELFEMPLTDLLPENETSISDEGWAAARLINAVPSRNHRLQIVRVLEVLAAHSERDG